MTMACAPAVLCLRRGATRVFPPQVGGDVDVLPEPGADGISGYNMGCRSLPNRVEHYHTPRMLIMCTTLMAAAAAHGAR